MVALDSGDSLGAPLLKRGGVHEGKSPTARARAVGAALVIGAAFVPFPPRGFSYKLFSTDSSAFVKATVGFLIEPFGLCLSVLVMISDSRGKSLAQSIALGAKR
jgi:hypothetical protein